MTHVTYLVTCLIITSYANFPVASNQCERDINSSESNGRSKPFDNKPSHSMCCHLGPVSLSPCALLKLDFLTNVMHLLYALVRKSSFSMAQCFVKPAPGHWSWN